MITCCRHHLAILSSGASGMLALIGRNLPSNIQEWSSAVAIVAGVCGAALSLQQIYINYRRYRRRRAGK